MQSSSTPLFLGLTLLAGLGFVPSAEAQLCSDFIVLGPTDGLSLDQPRVSIEVIGPGAFSLGPFGLADLLLDTAAERNLVVGAAASELLANGLTIEGSFEEQGVSGFTTMDVSAAYRFQYQDSFGTVEVLDPSRFMVNPALDFGGFAGIVGMPGMVGKLITLDYSPWSDGGIALMDVEFRGSLPADPGTRYSFEVRPVEFPLPAGTVAPFADDEPIPFLTAVASHAGTRVAADFAFDTGAQLTILSLHTAIAAGLDTNGNGSVEDEAIGFVPVGGVGGEINAPNLVVDELRLPTKEGVELVWTDVSVLVLDIHPLIDGVFGSDLLTAGWFDAVLFGGPDGYLQQVHLDFRNYPAGNGTIFFDLSPTSDNVQTVDRSDLDDDGVPDCWEEHFYGDTAMPGSSDTEGDRLSLFMEFAHGLDPTQPDLDPIEVRAGETGTVVFSYLRNTTASHLTYQVKSSANGGDWADVAGPETTSSAGLGIERVSITIAVTTPIRLIRLEVNDP